MLPDNLMEGERPAVGFKPSTTAQLSECSTAVPQPQIRFVIFVFFPDRPVQEIVALLSCLVFQQRNCSEPGSTPFFDNIIFFASEGHLVVTQVAGH